jgi:hypothetical protein
VKNKWLQKVKQNQKQKRLKKVADVAAANK